MLDEKRINEAKSNIKSYLADKLLNKESFKDIVFETYMRNHRESLALAEEVFKNNRSNLWVIVISYYSMFYIANAVLYKMGYKVGHKIAHKITADALIIFVRGKIQEALLTNYELAGKEALAISDNLMESFDYEREKRSRIQYRTTEEIKHALAKTSLERARHFSLELEQLLLE